MAVAIKMEHYYLNGRAALFRLMDCVDVTNK